MPRLPRELLTAVCCLLAGANLVAAQRGVRRESYRGWPEAVVVGNDVAEVVIVPAVGRVMQFRFRGEEGPFWEHAEFAGKSPDPQSETWGNFGGDKAWPAPQADWPRVTPRAWPPPPAFDAMPVRAEVKGHTVELVSPVDPYYGIRTRRRVALDAARPVMTITTAYEKVAGDPVKVAVWVVTQLRDPERIFVPVPAGTRFAGGYGLQSKAPPPDLRLEGGLLSLGRDGGAAYKIGSDAGTLLWVGARHALRIDSPRAAAGEYPDGGSSAEVYTAPRPLDYVELEMLGPLKLLRVGDRVEGRSTYTLTRRTEPSAAAEARKILGEG